MHTRTTLALLALVAAACLYLFGPWKDAGAETVLGRQMAFPGLQTSRLSSIELDNVRSDDQIVFERDAFAEWYIVDPVAWRAEPGSVTFLLQNLGSLVAEPAPDLNDELFGALQVRYEFTENIADGRALEHVLELGNLDFDKRRVAARIDGVYARVARPLLDIAERPLGEYRSKRLIQIDPSSILEVERSGELLLAGGARPEVGPEVPGGDALEVFDLGFRAVLEGGLWVAEAPERLRLSPPFVLTAVLNPFAAFQVTEFVDDAPVSYADYGLDPPAFEMTARLSSGDSLTLEFGYRPNEAPLDAFARRWLCRLRGESKVFGVSAGAISLFTKDVRTMADEQVFLLLRESVARVELREDKGGLAFERRREQFDDDSWGVQSAAGSAAWGNALQADPGLSEDVLNGLLDLSLAAWLDPDEYDGEPLRGSVRILSDAGEAWDLDVGPALELRGIDGYPVRRAGESLWGFAASDPLASALAEPRTFLVRRPFTLSELRVVQVGVRRGEERFGWGRESGSGVWKPEGLDAEDRDFARLVDALLAPRISSWLSADERITAGEGLQIELVSFDGRSDQRFGLARAERDGEPVTMFEQNGARGVLEGDILARLEGLLKR